MRIKKRFTFSDCMAEEIGIKTPFPCEQDLSDILRIAVERGPGTKYIEELDTLEKVMGAWNSKRELVVSLRQIPEIRKGKVGVFLKNGHMFLDNLNKNPCAKVRSS